MMAELKLTSLTLFSCITIFLLTNQEVNLASAPDCTNDCAPFIPGVVAYWPMTLKSKGLDLSGNENHATFEGLTYTNGPTGEENGAVHFNGSSNSFASVKNSPSMNVGKYPGFSFSGFVRYLGFRNKSASLIDWSGDGGYGVFIVVSSVQNSQLHLYPSQSVAKHITGFSNHSLIKGSWHFIGMSYDKATGNARTFRDGEHEVQQLDKNIAGGTDKTRAVGLGTDQADLTDFNYNGDMSCMMLFKFALTADIFEKVWRFCRTMNSAQTIIPITVTEITTTSATAKWTKSPGIFSGYSITIERKQIGLDREIVNPKFIPSNDTILKSDLTNLDPGATYRIHVWHMQGDLVGRERSSAWFNTKPSPVVGSDSITFSEITATSAKVSWKDVTGDFDGYSVDISPSTGGAKADPSTVPKRMNTTSLKNLSPRIYYTITIRAKIGTKMTTPSIKSFQTPDQTKANPPSILTIAAIVLAGVCLVAVIVLIILFVKKLRKINENCAQNVAMERITRNKDEGNNSHDHASGGPERNSGYDNDIEDNSSNTDKIESTNKGNEALEVMENKLDRNDTARESQDSKSALVRV